MWPESGIARTRFADWIRERLELLGLTEAETGQAIGRGPGWLDRFVSRRHARDDLSSIQANQIVRLLGGHPDVDLPWMVDSPDGGATGNEGS